MNRIFLWMMWVPVVAYQPLFNAIRSVETCECVCEASYSAVGDGGASIGPYQISRAYWADAVEECPRLGINHKYEDVRGDWYARQIMLAYWSRYSPDKKWETLARIHNGGPYGYQNDATIGYWQRVEERLTKGTRN